MQKPASPHTSLIFIFGSLNLKSPRRLTLLLHFLSQKGEGWGGKSVMCFGVLQFWMNNDFLKGGKKTPPSIYSFWALFRGADTLLAKQRNTGQQGEGTQELSVPKTAKELISG